FHYFELNHEKLEKYPILKKYPSIEKTSIIPSNEVDDLLLGHFEDLGIYLENKMLTLNFIYEGFEYYVKTIWKNEQIQKYITEIRKSKKEDKDFYDKFESIYKSVISHGEEKNENTPPNEHAAVNAGHRG
ncbi:MAG TPA: hypothetical protein VIK14_05535, partial [Ignavibacteria bacterium]